MHRNQLFFYRFRLCKNCHNRINDFIRNVDISIFTKKLSTSNYRVKVTGTRRTCKARTSVLGKEKWQHNNAKSVLFYLYHFVRSTNQRKSIEKLLNYMQSVVKPLVGGDVSKMAKPHKKTHTKPKPLNC